MLEGFLCLCVVALLTRTVSFRHCWQTLRSGRRWQLVGLLALLVAGQLFADYQRTYPLTDWGMYTKSLPNEVHQYQFDATVASGERITLNLDRHFPTLGRKFYWRTGKLAWDAEYNSDTSDKARTELRLRLLEIAERYNQTHGDNPILALTVVHYCRPALPYYSVDSNPTRHNVLTVRTTAASIQDFIAHQQ